MADALIELRQADRDDPSKEVDGEYSITLNDPIAIMNGDTVAVRNVYLDTEASADAKIHIDQDLTLTMQNGFYYQMIRGDQQDNTTLATAGYVADAGKEFVDGRTYVMCTPADTGAGNYYLDSMELYNEGDSGQPPWKPTSRDSGGDGNHTTFWWQCTLLYKHVGDPPGPPFREYPLLVSGADGNRVWNGQSPIDGEWEYTLGSTPMTENFSYDPTADITVDYGSNGGVQTQKGLLIAANSFSIAPGSPNGADTIQLLYTDYNNGPIYNLKFIQFGKHFSSTIGLAVNTTYPSGNDTYAPYTRSVNFTLEAGDYTPAELTTRINRNIQGNNTTDFTNPIVNSNFLIQYNIDDYPGTVFVEEGMGNATILNARNEANDPALNGGMLIGATQMVLDYDEDKGVFFWSYIHSPMYGLEGTTNYDESVGFTKTENLASNNDKVIAVSRNGGIFFRSLSAALPDGTSFEFWGGKDKPGGVLGFTLEDLIAPVKQYPAGTKVAGWEPKSIEMLSAPLLTGTNATTGFIGLDDIATRGASSAYWYMPAISTGSPFLSDSNGVTREIRAASTQFKSTDIGYFLVDVASQWGGVQYIGANGYRNDSIRAVVGRYYSAASYTMGTTADAVPYTHKGEPIVLNSFTVRILGPDKQTAANLGGDTAVVLEVVRAERALGAR